MFVTEVTPTLCFGCRDSSSIKGKDDCQVNTYKMEELHTEFINDYRSDTKSFLADFKNHPYVQDCTVLVNHSKCCMEEFEGGGMFIC